MRKGSCDPQRHIGEKYGRLLITEFSHRCPRRSGYWKCVCDCGNDLVVMYASLRSGNTRSCGCLQTESKNTSRRFFTPVPAIENDSSNKRMYRKVKKTFIEMYGNKCVCCGELEEVFLTIDHISGQVGKAKKETSYHAYRRAIEKHNPEEFRILCMNCNMAVKGGRTCPHQKK